MRNLKPPPNIPWFIIGDFNEILTQKENKGGCPRAGSVMEKFRNTLDDLGLNDLEHRGDIYTWSNKHRDESFTKERLDRTVANQKWFQIYGILGLSV